jgi:hypothetical protein
MPRSEQEPTTVVEVESSPGDGLPDLIGRLGQDVIELIDSRLSLMKIELDEAARSYAKGAVDLAIAAIVALVGFALCATALAFAVTYLLPEGRLDPGLNRAIAFGAVGGVALIVGVAFAVRGKARFSGTAAAPGSRSRRKRRSDGAPRTQED